MSSTLRKQQAFVPAWSGQIFFSTCIAVAEIMQKSSRIIDYGLIATGTWSRNAGRACAT